MVGWQGAALVAAAVVLSGCTAFAGGFETVESAGWQPGFRFVYGVEGESRIAVVEREDGVQVRSEEEAETETLERRRTIEVVGTHEQDGRSYYLAVETFHFSGNILQPRLVAFRTSDLAVSTAVITGEGIRVGDSRSEGPVRFPLVAGDRYSYGGGSQPRTDVRVHGMETVAGPDGPVRAVEVVHVPDPDDLRRELAEDFAEDAEAEVEGTWEMEMAAFFAPSLHAVVEERMDVIVDAEVTYTKKGVEHRVTLEGEFHARERLMEARLEPSAPLSLDALRALLSGLPSGIPEPLPGPGSPSLQLVLPDGHVQVAGTGVVPVEVRGDGVEGPVVVKLLHGFDVYAQRSAPLGTRVELPVPGAGVFSVVAATTGDDPYATAHGLVAVDSAFEALATCPQVGLPSATCDPLPFRVLDGVASVRFSALHAPLVAEPIVGTLRIWDPAAAETTETMAGQSATVWAEGQPGSWIGRLDPLGPVAGQVAYRVELVAHDVGEGGGRLHAARWAAPWPLDRV
jgi:hypothetical protein